MQAFEVGDFGSIAGFDQSFESGANQFGRAAAEHGLLAEQIAFGFFAESGFDHAGAQATERRGIGQRVLESLAAGILLDRDERRDAGAFDEDFADAMAGSLGRDHRNIDIRGRLDEAEMDVESVGEHQGFAFGQVAARCRRRRDRPGCDRVPGSSSRRRLSRLRPASERSGRRRSALARLLLFVGRPTTTSSPESRRFNACAWPWEP